MKTICVRLDSSAGKALQKLVEINDCTISDAVCAALMAFSLDLQPVIFNEDSVLQPVINACNKSRYQTLVNWCSERQINRQRLRYLLASTKKGASISGFGNTKNKWRDKNDDRQFKTHTAWIAHCLKEDLGIDLI